MLLLFFFFLKNDSLQLRILVFFCLLKGKGGFCISVLLILLLLITLFFKFPVNFLVLTRWGILGREGGS